LHFVLVVVGGGVGGGFSLMIREATVF